MKGKEENASYLRAKFKYNLCNDIYLTVQQIPKIMFITKTNKK